MQQVGEAVYEAVRDRYPDVVARDLELKGRSAPVPAYVVDVGALATAPA